MNSYTKLRLSVLLLLGLMVAVIWDNYHRYQEYKILLYYQLDSRLHDSALIGSKLLGDGFHNNLIDKNSVSAEMNYANEAKLNMIADHSSIKYIYSLFLNNGNIRIGASSNTKQDHSNNMASKYFDLYPEIEKRAKEVLESNTIMYYEYTDKWGSFRSILLPLKSSNGTPYVMVADIAIEDVNAMLNHAFIDFVQRPFALLILISGLGFYYIRLSDKVTQKLQNSNEELEQLRQTLESKIAEKTLDLEVKNHELQKINMTLENRVDQEIEKNIEKDHQLIHQSRLAQLGEMVSMIAHQWRQPLAAIGANVLDIKLKFSLDKFDLSSVERQNLCKNYIETSLSEIDDNIKMLTTTIDDFRNFYKADKAVKTLSIHTPIDQAIKVMKPSFEANNILVTQDYRATRMVDMYDSEITQVCLNILKNAQDNFLERNIENPVVMISTFHTQNQGIGITFCDNGGGIDDDIVDKIFDPYFSTKDELNGTGLGLYMSKTIIEEHHKGSLTVSKIPRGVCFKIELEGTRS